MFLYWTDVRSRILYTHGKNMVLCWYYRVRSFVAIRHFGAVAIERCTGNWIRCFFAEVEPRRNTGYWKSALDFVAKILLFCAERAF